VLKTPGPDEFQAHRAAGNARLAELSRSARAIADLDADAYAAGALGTREKELMGLAISFAKDCEECVYHHLGQLLSAGLSREQIVEAIDVVLVGCGSVGIPLARKAVAYLDASAR
jgi:AhpD family alkylhydroperoxidase